MPGGGLAPGDLGAKALMVQPAAQPARGDRLGPGRARRIQGLPGHQTATICTETEITPKRGGVGLGVHTAAPGYCMSKLSS